MNFFKLSKKAKFIFILSIAKIVADITIIIGFFIIIFIIAKALLF